MRISHNIFEFQNVAKKATANSSSNFFTNPIKGNKLVQTNFYSLGGRNEMRKKRKKKIIRRYNFKLFYENIYSLVFVFKLRIFNKIIVSLKLETFYIK